MRKYSVILFDADDTLFDFGRAEARAFGIVMGNIGIKYDDACFGRYRKMNEALWERFNQGKITKETLQETRFRDFLRSEGIECSDEKGIAVNSAYVNALADCPDILPGAEELCKRLYGDFTMYIVTNGVSKTQKKRFYASPIARYFDEIFVSEDAGAPKPMKLFFDYVFAKIGEDKRSCSVIIGDSLSSDIAGGNLNGIDSIWYNPTGKAAPEGDIRPTYSAGNYSELLELLYKGDN